MNFLNKYNNKKNIRFEMFKKVFNVSLHRKHKTIVETGTSRGKVKFFLFKKYNWKDGMSTIMFANFAQYIGGHLHTCDISEKNIRSAKFFTKLYNKYVSFYVNDSLSFLKNFDKQIDLLYLDSLDGHNSDLASNHQLNEAKIAIRKLNKNSLVLLDDKGSKTILSIDFLLNNHFKILHETNYQVLLSR